LFIPPSEVKQVFEQKMQQIVEKEPEIKKSNSFFSFLTGR
jgi:hypothetical protein